MSTVTTLDPTKPSTDLDLVMAFARKMAAAGEEPCVRALWGNHYRINYFLRSEQRIGRSLFVRLSGGEIKVSKMQ